MIKKTTKAKKIVAEPTHNLSEKPAKKMSFFKYTLFLVIVFGVFYLLKGFFVVALVNGSPISRFSLISSLEKRYGKQSLDELVSKKIILSEAKSKDINVRSNEIDMEIGRITKLVESQGSTLDEALLAQGQTIEDLRENIKIQKTLELILGDTISVSDEEAMKYFEENKETFEKDVKFEDIKVDLISSLKQQKMGTEFEKWLTEKKASAKIMYFVDFK